MRVGIDASNIRAGGGITHLVELLRAARPYEHGIQQIIVWSGQATLRQLPERPWLRLVHDPMLNRSLLWRQAWRFSRLPLLVVRSCEVLFTPGATSQCTQLPCVTMCQNMLPFESHERRRFGWSIMRAKLHLLEYSQRRSFQQAEGIIFLTHYARYTVQQRIGRLQSSQAVIPHGIAAEFRAAPRTAQPLGYFSLEKPFRIIYVSAITVYKHQWHVAEAVAQLRRAGYPVTLDLIGPAYLPALRHLQAVLRRIDPNQEFIRYVGPVDYCQLPNWYRQADAFVYASSCENLPIILLEAMAAGIPIACSNRKPMPDILGQGGIYFDPENVADIAIALQTLLADHRLRGQYAELAFEQSQAYTWDKCATDTFEFLAQTLRSHGNKL